mgnify:CR=1 FL=1
MYTSSGKKGGKILKKTIKLIFIVMVIAIINILLLLNTVQAVEKGGQITIYTKGYFDRIIKKDQTIVKTAHAVYQENGKEYPVYCLNRELHGVGDYIAKYDVENQGKLTDLGLWRIIVNGYPYKTPEQLGVANEQEAYIATKQAIYCYIYNTKLEQYTAINEAGTRATNAMSLILENAGKSTEDFNNTNVEISQSEKWEVDKIENKYISKKYQITSNINISKFILKLENQPKGTKIVDLENQERKEFNSKESFKILIPISSLEESGEFKVKIQTQMETKPIFFGKAPSGELQDYALTAFSYENVDTELIQKYEKNDTEIIVEKQDIDTKETLKNAKFEILDDNQKVIRVIETDENGQIILEKLMPGTYYIREVKAPDGYVLDMELHEINISLNEKIILKVFNNKIVIINNNSEQEQPKEPKVEKIVPVVEIPKLPVTGM